MVYGRPARLERSFQVRMGGGERSDPPARGVLYPGKNKGCQETRGYLVGVSQIRVIKKKHKTKERSPLLIRDTL